MEKKSYYDVTYDKLSSLIRTGWIYWGVDVNRLESDTEHIYLTQILALAMVNQYPSYYQDIDLPKVHELLVNHEIGEAKYGDVTPFDKAVLNKKQEELKAVNYLTSRIKDGWYHQKLFIEFDYNLSKEAFFAYLCDKGQTNYKVKGYCLEKCCINYDHQYNNPAMKNKRVSELLATNSFEDMWLKCELGRINFDECFVDSITNVLNYHLGDSNIDPVFKMMLSADKLTDYPKYKLGDDHHKSIADIIVGAEFLALSDIKDLNLAKVTSLIIFDSLNLIGDIDLINNLNGKCQALYKEAVSLETDEAKAAYHYLNVAFGKCISPKDLRQLLLKRQN